MTNTTGPSSARSGMPHRADGPDFQANRHQARKMDTGADAMVSAHAVRERQQEPDLKSDGLDCLHRSLAGDGGQSSARRETARIGAGPDASGMRDPAIHDALQSMMGIVRETTGVLCNITELGLAPLWSPKSPRPKRSFGRTGPSLPNSATIIPFALASKRRAFGQD